MLKDTEDRHNALVRTAMVSQNNNDYSAYCPELHMVYLDTHVLKRLLATLFLDPRIPVHMMYRGTLTQEE